MSHWVFRLGNGTYVGTRKATSRMYEARTSVAATLDEARVFNTASAASNAGSSAGFEGRVVKLYQVDHP